MKCRNPFWIDQEEAHFTQRIEPNTVGPIMSVRVFDFDSLYGLDMLVPSTKHIQEKPRFPGHTATLQAERFHWYDKARRNT